MNIIEKKKELVVELRKGEDAIRQLQAAINTKVNELQQTLGKIKLIEEMDKDSTPTLPPTES